MDRTAWLASSRLGQMRPSYVGAPRQTRGSVSERPSCCFFFSSRRRHTRSLCDWSSDVCSSDLDWLFMARFLSGWAAGLVELAGPVGEARLPVCSRNERRRLIPSPPIRTHGHRDRKSVV